MRRELLSVAAAVAVLAGAAKAAAPEIEFSALIKAPNMQSVAGGAGVAAFKSDDRGIHFSVDIGGIKRITNIVLLVNGQVLDLYSGSATDKSVFNTAGTLEARNLKGLSMEDVVRGMESGKAQVRVFTTTLVDGSISGNVERILETPDDSDLKAPDIKVPEVKIAPPTT